MRCGLYERNMDYTGIFTFVCMCVLYVDARQVSLSPPRNVRARFEGSSVVVEWDKQDVPSGAIQGYRIYYTDHSELPIVLWSRKIVDTETTDVKITDMSPYNTYYVSVLAFGETGQGPLSQPVAVKTTGGEYQETGQSPRNLRVEPKSPNEIHVHWEHAPDQESIDSYTLYYNESIGRHNGEVTITAARTSYTLTDLMPGTIYYIQLEGRNRRGETGKTDSVQVRTPEFIPGEPKGVTGNAINSTAIHVSWKEPTRKQGDGVIRGYRIYYLQIIKDDLPFRASEQSTDTMDGEIREHVIAGLKDDTGYIVSVSGYTRKGDGIRSRTKEIRTNKRSIPLSPPRNVRARSEGSSVVVEWDKPEVPSGAIQGYRVYYTRQNELPMVLWSQKKVDTDTTDIKITDMSPNYTYYVSVLAFGDNGQGPLSIPVAVKTTGGEYQENGQLPRNLGVEPKSPNEIHVHWEHAPDQDSIDSYTLYYNESIGRHNGEVTITAASTSYTLTDLMPGTIYYIQLEGRNRRGETGKTDSVQVITPEFIPGEPKGVTVNAINSTAIHVSWKEPTRKQGDGVIRGYIIYYSERTKDDLPLHASEQSMDTMNGEKREHVIAGLKADTGYTVSVSGYTRRGDGIRSRTKLIRTKKMSFTVRLSPPRNVRARFEGSSVVVEWDKPDVPSSAIQGYRIYYTDHSELPIVLWSQKIVETETTDVKITDMSPYNTYYVSVLAFGETGQGPISQPVAVKTTGGEYQETGQSPRNLRLEPKSPNEIHVHWEHAPDQESIDSYTLYYNESIGRHNGSVTITAASTSYTLTDLMPGTIYYIQLEGRNRRGETGKTDSVQIRTPEFIPGEPKSVTVNAINSTAIHVSWKEPTRKQGDGVIRGYRIYYSEIIKDDLPFHGSEQSMDTMNGEKREHVIAGLKADTGYTVFVSGYTRKGDGIRSRPKEIRTKRKSIPMKPKRVTVKSINSTTVHVSWTDPRRKKYDGLIRGYVVYYSESTKEDVPLDESEQSMDTKNGEIREFVITGLKPDTGYTVSVSGYTRKGNGIRSKPKSFRTVNDAEYSANHCFRKYRRKKQTCGGYIGQQALYSGGGPKSMNPETCCSGMGAGYSTTSVEKLRKNHFACTSCEELGRSNG